LIDVRIYLRDGFGAETSFIADTDTDGVGARVEFSDDNMV